VKNTAFNRGNKNKFPAMKVPRQCPFVLLVKVGWREDKAFGSEKVGDEKRSEERSWAGSYWLRSEFWILTTLGGRNFLVNTGGAAWEACSTAWNLGTNSALALGPRKSTGKPWSTWPVAGPSRCVLILASSPVFKFASPNGSPCLCCCFLHLTIRYCIFKNSVSITKITWYSVKHCFISTHWYISYHSHLCFIYLLFS
jgi:hypothetical protein